MQEIVATTVLDNVGVHYCTSSQPQLRRAALGSLCGNNTGCDTRLSVARDPVMFRRHRNIPQLHIQRLCQTEAMYSCSWLTFSDSPTFLEKKKRFV